MSEPAILEPPVYDRVDGGGYRVKDEDRERWDYNGWIKSSGSKHWRSTPTAGPELPTLQTVSEALDNAEIYLDDRLRAMLVDAYDIDPRTTAQAALHVSRSTGLTNPPGLLAKRLREIIATRNDIPL